MSGGEIRIGDVIRQTEQAGFNLVECFEQHTNACPIAPVCSLKGWLAKAMEALLAHARQRDLGGAHGEQEEAREAPRRLISAA